jgi:hypothetical protein
VRGSRVFNRLATSTAGVYTRPSPEPGASAHLAVEDNIGLNKPAALSLEIYGVGAISFYSA